MPNYLQCGERATHPGMDLPSPFVFPPSDPEGDEAVKKTRRDSDVQKKCET